MSNALYIIFGLFLTFLTYFLIVWGLCSLFFWISKDKINILKNLKISASLSAIGFVISILLMIFLSGTNIYIKAAGITFVSLGAYWTLLKYLWKFKNFDAIIIGITLSILLNPSWLSLMGIL